MSPKPPPTDDSCWQEEIRTVKPLGNKSAPDSKTPAAPPSSLPQRHHRVAGWNTQNPVPIVSNTAECIAGLAPHQNKGLLKDLAQGKIHPTAILDLHGLGEGDAWLELTNFLHDAAHDNHRCALIIHGKGQGYGPERNMGVIKFQIATWLAGHPRTLAFHTAHPAHGGSGAIYVYLKRHL